MMVTVENWLRRWRRELQRLLLMPQVRGALSVFWWWSGGFFLSAGGIGGFCQPLALGLVCGSRGWKTIVSAFGALLGYLAFWGKEGIPGAIWAVFGSIAAFLFGRQQKNGTYPLLLPIFSAVLVAVTGLLWQFALGAGTPVGFFFLQIPVAFGVAWLFDRVAQKEEMLPRWMALGVAVFALAQAAPLPWLSPGFLAAGMLGVCCSFPGAVMAGLGLDLARVTAVPMTGVLCLGFFLRLIPFRNRHLRLAAPGAACLGIMAVCGIWEWVPLPGLVLGGAAGLLVPPRPQPVRRQGQTGFAQVRLEMGAAVLAATQRLLLEAPVVPIDEEAILQRVKQRSCAQCSLRRSCSEKLTAAALRDPLAVQCARSGRLTPELRRGREQLRQLKADQVRRGEYRAAVCQQYQFLGEFLQSLSDQLPRRGEGSRSYYRIQVSARSRGKERANGDQCLAFAGTGCKYYVLLCDGMGTGLGADWEGKSAGELLRKMLIAGFPAEHALRSINSILALRGCAGAVTLDLAEVRLDTGIAYIYKWGAAPSWVLKGGRAEKIGTATPPPGISVTGIRETVEKLSLRRGEVLILLSDGVDGEGVLRRFSFTPEAPPGEIAAKLTEKGRGKAEDDASAMVIRLRPLNLRQ